MLKSLLVLIPALAGYMWLTNPSSNDNAVPMERASTSPMGKIVLDRIPQQEIRDFILEQIKNDVTSFQALVPTYYPGDSLEGFSFHEKDYQFDYPLDVLWGHYLSANPSEAWNGNMVSFGLMVSKKEDDVMYIGGAYDGAEVGQVLFINIEVLGGLFKVPVAQEIIAIEPDENYIEISYVKGGKSAGKQRITFHDNGDGTTHVNHATYYRSASRLRDKMIYPFFHTLAIDEYHENMIGSLEQKVISARKASDQ